MSRFLKLGIGVLVLFMSLTILTFSYYVYALSPTSDNKETIEVEIPKGSSGSKVASILKASNLIRNTTVFKFYIKIHNVEGINYGVYQLNKNMGVKQIVDIISSGKSVNKDIKILFKEGQNMRVIAKTIANNTNNTEDDVFNLLNDKEYINSLIEEYWFLTDDIKNKDIYYPLEGYLAPNTYNFTNKDVSVDEIFRRMLNQTNKVLTPYKDDINKTGFTVHEFITLASVVQSEGIDGDDWPKIASVFYNRLDKGIGLESCVTACYATKTDQCIPKNVNTKFSNPYNTYLTSMAGKLPIGPISNPGVAAIKATLNPADTDYFFFLSDIDKKTYFSKTYDEHRATQAHLIATDKWASK